MELLGSPDVNKASSIVLLNCGVEDCQGTIVEVSLRSYERLSALIRPKSRPSSEFRMQFF